MNQTCLFCETKPATKKNLFCEDCFPRECIECSQPIENVYTENNTMKFECENNHIYTYKEILDRFYKDRIYNFNRDDQIKYGGARSEAIIPNSDLVNSIASKPDQIDPDPNELVLWHGTYDKDKILEEGFKTPSELDREDMLNDRYKNTLRYDSVYGWPFKYTSGPNDYPESKVVYFSVNFSNVVISFYTYLDAYQYDYITLSEYENKFYFEPDEYLKVIEDTNRPYEKQEILYFDYFDSIKP